MQKRRVIKTKEFHANLSTGKGVDEEINKFLLDNLDYEFIDIKYNASAEYSDALLIYKTYVCI